jgi:hypothetical protein
MSKLIIDTQTGTILNIEHCYVIDANDLSENDFTCAELQAVADRSGVSISTMGRDTGWGDNKYSYTVSYSPKSIHDECLMFLEGEIYDETDREWYAVKWVLETATQEQIEDLSSSIMDSDNVWNEYRSNLMETLMFVYAEETQDLDSPASK